MSEVRIAAEPRTEFGKGGARRTRRAGKLPAVLYGHGTPPRHIALPARDFSHALKTGAGANVLLRLDVDGGTELALAKAIQRNPVRGSIEHVDLLLVRRGEKVVVEIPVSLVGEAPRDGIVEQHLTTLSVEAEATHIPQSVEVSLAGLGLTESVLAGQVALPPGVTLQADPETVVVHISPQLTEEQIEADLAGAEAELGAGPAAATAAGATPADAAPTGAGDIVPDTDSGEGGPAQRHA